MSDGIPESLTALSVAVDSLKPYGKNPRRGNVDVIARSLEVNGQYRPVVVNSRTSEVLAGNHTLMAVQQLGWPMIAATFVDADPEQAAKIVLVDNRSNDLAGYDDAMLLEILQSVSDLDGTGYDSAALDELMASITELPPALDDPDAVPEVPAVPVSVLGDVWLLGPHRLVCGDSTDIGVFDALLGDDKAALLWTDPPYGVDYVGKTKDALTLDNDSRDLGALQDLLSAALGAAGTACLPGAAVYVAAPPGPATLPFVRVLTDLGWWRQTLVWVKDAFVLGHSDYHYRHEFIYAGYVAGYEGRRGRGGLGWYGDNATDSVLEVPRPKASKLHPTMKPVALIERMVANSSRKGDLVLDCFAGSGSTLIACHVTGRIARLVESDPRYVDVICRRYQDATGTVPILESTSEPHDFTDLI